MELNLNTEQEVNQKQYLFIKHKLSSLIAYRERNGKYFIKPLLFQGMKKNIESILNELK